MRDAHAVLLGLAGFGVVAANEHGGGLKIAVETTAEPDGCPGCGVVATAYARRPVRVRDVAFAGRPASLIWFTGPWRWEQQLCEKATWPGTSAEAAGAGVADRAGAGPGLPNG